MPNASHSATNVSAVANTELAWDYSNQDDHEHGAGRQGSDCTQMPIIPRGYGRQTLTKHPWVQHETQAEYDDAEQECRHNILDQVTPKE